MYDRYVKNREIEIIEITALIGFEEEKLQRMFITLREDIPNGNLPICKGQDSDNTSKYCPVSLSILMNILTLNNES